MAGFDYKTEEHFHYMELEHEREHDAHSDNPDPRHVWCQYERSTGDKKYPVLCERDGKYARQKECESCKKRRYIKEEDRA